MKKRAQKVLTFSGPQLTTWAVFLLGGDQKRIDTEDVAIKVFELAPGRFAWRKHPSQINLELVRVYLSDAKKEGHGKLLTGSGKTGWSLTQVGLSWAKHQYETHGVASINIPSSRAGSIDGSRFDRERRRIVSMPAWRRWVSGDRDVVLAEAQAVFRIDSYSTEAVQEAKITRLHSMFGDDESIGPFLAALSDALAKSLGTL